MSACTTTSAAADSNTNATNDMLLVYNADYELSQGQIVLQNTSTVANKTIQIIGNGRREIGHHGGRYEPRFRDPRPEPAEPTI